MMDPNNHKWRVRPDFVSTVADISNAEYKRIFNEISQNCHSEFQVYIDTLYNCKVLISDSEILTTGFQCKEAGKLVYKLLQQLVVENYPIAWTDKLVFVAQNSGLNQMNYIQTPQVVMGSFEWKKVEARFKETLPNKSIHSIVRVQNKFIWQKYYQTFKEMKSLNHGQDPLEMELWHGTSGTHPEKIWEDREGLCMQYSRQGMWGRALYFA